MGEISPEVESMQKDPQLERKFVLNSLFLAEARIDPYNNQKYVTLNELAQSVNNPEKKLDPSLVFLAASEALLKIHELGKRKDYKRSLQDALSGTLPNLMVHESQILDAVLKIQGLRKTHMEKLLESRNYGRTMIKKYASTTT